MTSLETYANRYKTIRITRSEGMLEVAIHQGGGPAVWSARKGDIHDELGDAFYHIGRDAETRVVIFTGMGDEFLARTDLSDPEPITKVLGSDLQRR